MNDTVSRTSPAVESLGDDGIVLHVSWNEETSTFLAWAESVAAWCEASIPRRGRPKSRQRGGTVKNGAAAQHPFALHFDRLGQVITDLMGNVRAGDMLEGTTTMMLPEANAMPLPSTDFQDIVSLYRDDPTTKDARDAVKHPVTGAWDVPCIAIPPRVAMDGLLAPRDTIDEIKLATSCRYWKEVMKIVLDMVLQHQYLPVYGTPWSKWIPMLQPRHHEHLDLLARAMPGACIAPRCTGGHDHGSIRRIIEKVIHVCIDEIIRSTLAGSREWSNGPGINQKGKSDPPGLARWLLALSTIEPSQPPSTRGNNQLSARLENWINPTPTLVKRSPFRTCFKLEPPADDAPASAPWHLGYYLQGTADPTLLVPASTAWKNRSTVLRYLKHEFENPQERLLEDLGRATRVFPAIETSLNQARPCGLDMNGGQVVDFIQKVAPVLDQSGFGVIVPSWWKGVQGSAGIALTLRSKSPKTTGGGILGLESIVSYDWYVAIGDDKIAPDEFEELARLKQPLLRWRGRWVMFKPDDTKKLLDFIHHQRAASRSIGDMTLDVAMKALATGNVPGLDAPPVRVECEGELKATVENLTNRGKIKSIPVPSGFTGILRPYQELGLSWLAFLRSVGFGACLADDMGLGKTIQVIALLLHDKEQRMRMNGAAKRGGRRATRSSPARDLHSASLLVCPVSIMDNWKREFHRFAPSLQIFIHHGQQRLKKHAVEAAIKSRDVIITTYALAARDKVIFEQPRWNVMVIDEAQNIKNHFAKQTQAVKNFKCSWRVALTGTPVENRLSELWSIMDFLNPTYLGSHDSFHKRFSIPIERYKDPDSTGILKRLVQPFILRRLKTDKKIIKDLPEKVEIKEYCHLSREQASLYEAIVNDMLENIGNVSGIQRKGMILSSIMKLKQVCNHPAQFLHDGSKTGNRSGKITRLESLVEEIVSIKEKVIIFTQFRETGTILQNLIQERFKVNVLFLHGGTTKKRRDDMIQRFQSHPRFPVLILSLKAGGVGLNLTAATNVIHFDRWWNPAVENQATDRAYRIGQSRNEFVRKFICTGTLEERIDDMIERKKELATNVIQAGESWITEISTNQIKELLALDRDAIKDESNGLDGVA